MLKWKLVCDYLNAEADEDWIWQDSVRVKFRELYGIEIEDYMEGSDKDACS